VDGISYGLVSIFLDITDASFPCLSTRIDPVEQDLTLDLDGGLHIYASSI
jgi:hypothetical protein